VTTTKSGNLSDVVYKVVDRRIGDLQARFLNPQYRDPAAVAALARLRRAVGKGPTEVRDVFEFTLHPELVAGWTRDEPSPAERAAHIAITLYALHQQSRAERMHRHGRGLGAALRSLHKGEQRPIPEPLVRRFRLLTTADSFDELTYHMRGAVQLLRTGHIPLDYGRLAAQLYRCQAWGLDRVQLTWGREFYRARQMGDDTGEPANLPTD
jgi:CRISPR system Cascade subunit CasB